MSDQVETKICPFCAETINAAAKVCPFCQSRRGRFEFLKGELATAIVVIPLALLSLALLMWRFPEDEHTATMRSFALHRHNLPVVRCSLQSAEGNRDMWLTGFATNKGSRPWRVHEFEVRAFDEQGNLIDVQRPSFKKWEAFVVEPGQEHAFRVALDKRANASTNVTLAVRVQSVSDGRQRYDPD